MNQSYEMMYILRPDLSEEQVDEAINKYRDFLVEQGAEEIEIQLRGRRRLAYEIQRHSEGIYVQLNYRASGKQVAPLEQSMRLSDEVIRYLTLKTPEKEPTVEASEPVEAEA